MEKENLNNKLLLKDILGSIRENKGLYDCAFLKINSCNTLKEIYSVVNEINRRKNDHLFYVGELRDLNKQIGPIYSQLNYLEILN